MKTNECDCCANTCEIHAHIEGIRHRTSCAMCFTEQGHELERARAQIAALEIEVQRLDRDFRKALGEPQ